MNSLKMSLWPILKGRSGKGKHFKVCPCCCRLKDKFTSPVLDLLSHLTPKGVSDLRIRVLYCFIYTWHINVMLTLNDKMCLTDEVFVEKNAYWCPNNSSTNLYYYDIIKIVQLDEKQLTWYRAFNLKVFFSSFNWHSNVKTKEIFCQLQSNKDG